MSDAPLDPHLTLQAALDGELDAAGQAAFERQLAADPALAATYARHLALRRALQAQFPRTSAPAALHARLQAAVSPTIAEPAHAPRRDFMKMAAALALGIGLGGSATYLALQRGTPGLDDALIANHRRALLAGSPVDIASNDRHNVRPWFDARIAISPPTPDLAAQGFPLLGAPAPVLVYRIGAHVVSVTALPGTVASRPTVADAGFHILSWRHAGFTFLMTTDAEEQELVRFAETFKAAVTGAPAP
mgnify:CR=1 FL=1